VDLPAELFQAAAPAEAKALSEVRPSAKVGDIVSFRGYVGGRVEPFVEGRSMFLVADAVQAAACVDDMSCSTPWDSCCTASDVIAANSATIQVVDVEGQVLKTGLNGKGGLAPGATVTVTGKVREAGDGAFIVDASGIALAPPAP